MALHVHAIGKETEPLTRSRSPKLVSPGTDERGQTGQENRYERNSLPKA
jgi:hypothetical protein